MNQQQRPGPLRIGGLDRRGFLGLTLAGMSAAALSACGGGPSTSGGGGAASKVEQIDFSGVKPASQITFWSSNPGDSQQVTQQIIDAFHKSQSDIKVKLVNAGADYEELAQKFQTAQTSGKLPDLVVLSDVWWFRYMMNDQIIPVDSLYDTLGFETDDYIQQLLEDYNYNDAHWAVPWARSTPIFYYNKEHFSKAGVDPEKALATWQDFAEAAPKLMQSSGAKYAFQLPALAGYAGWSFQNNLWAWGGGWSKKDSFEITCDSDESLAAIQFLKDAVYKDKWSGVASTDSTQDLAAGVASATVASTGSLVSVLDTAKFDVGVAPVPGGPKIPTPSASNPVCPTGGSGIGIPKQIDKSNQLAAATFIKFLTSPENTVLFSQATGYMPIRESADTKSLLAKVPEVQTALDQLSMIREQDYARVFLPNGDIEMANHCANILTQDKDVKSEMSALKATLEKIYEQQVKPHLA